jgi:hypothetical protein
LGERARRIGTVGVSKQSRSRSQRTFGRRRGAADLSFEDHQDLLGHHSGRIATHYSQAELTSLIEVDFMFDKTTGYVFEPGRSNFTACIEACAALSC